MILMFEESAFDSQQGTFLFATAAIPLRPTGLL
jgi:hypothetical protein